MGTWPMQQIYRIAGGVLGFSCVCSGAIAGTVVRLLIADALCVRAGASSAETEGVRKLRKLCSRLSSEGGVEALFEALQSSTSISTFEFLTSGTVAKLKDFLLGAIFPSSGAIISVAFERVCFRSGQREGSLPTCR